MTKLSFSTLSELYNCRMSWLNKLMGLPKHEPHYFEEGRLAHRVIQDHMSGKKKDSRLLRDGVDILPEFSIVEEEDFDPRLKFESPITWRDLPSYYLFGYMDGKNKDSGRILEIKTSNTPWSPKRFEDSMQWRFYALCNDWVREIYLVTCTRGLANLKVMHREVTPADLEQARAWVDGAISIIESGNFNPPEGETCKSCYYINCPCPGCKDMKIYGR